MKSQARTAALRLSFSAALLGLLFRFGGADLGGVRSAMQAGQPRYLLAALFAYAFLGSVVRGARWRTLVRTLGHEVGLMRCTDLFLVGTFFNQLLPTGFGGDVVRSLLLGRDGLGGARAASTVVVDRAIGIMMLLPVGAIALALTRHRVPTGLWAALLVATVIGLVGSLVLLSAPRWRGRLTRLPGLGRLATWPALARFADSFAEYDARALLTAAAWSVLFTGLLIAANVLTGRAMGASGVSVLDWCLVVPLVSLSTLLPSVGGWGVREWTYVGLLGMLQVPVSPSQATAVSVYFGLMNWLVASVGGLRLLGQGWPAPVAGRLDH